MCVCLCAFGVNCTFQPECVESCHAANFVGGDAHVNASVGGRGLADGENATAPPCGGHLFCGRSEGPLDLGGRVSVSGAFHSDVPTGGHLHGGVALAEAWGVYGARDRNGISGTAGKTAVHSGNG